MRRYRRYGFLKTLTAEYLKLKGYSIPTGNGVLDTSEPPNPEEMEDAYNRFAKLDKVQSRKESRAYSIRGTQESAHTLHIITGVLPLDKVKAECRTYGVSITEYLAAVLMQVIYDMQRDERRKKKLPIKISLPVNLRSYYPTQTLRNFAIVVNPGIDPGYGEYTFEEIVRQVHHYMRYETTEKHVNARLARNVKSERNLFVRLSPLFVKNIIMRMVFRRSGESRFSSTITNLGLIDTPDEMQEHIERFDFMLGPSRFNRVNCAVAGYNGALSITFTRTIRESWVEQAFFTYFVRKGIHVKIESNQELIQACERSE